MFTHLCAILTLSLYSDLVLYHHCIIIPDKTIAIKSLTQFSYAYKPQNSSVNLAVS